MHWVPGQIVSEFEQAREPGYTVRIVLGLALLTAVIVPFFWKGAPYVGAFLFIFVAVAILPPVWLVAQAIDYFLRRVLGLRRRG